MKMKKKKKLNQLTTSMEESLFYKSPNTIIFPVFNQLHSSTMMKRSLSTAASSSVVYSLFRRNPRSVDSIINLHFNRSLSSDCSGSFKHGDNMKDLERKGDLVGTQKKIKVPESCLHQFRRKKILSVSNIISWDRLNGLSTAVFVGIECLPEEWCGKQTEFKLLIGKPKDTTPMKEGRAHHRRLAKEKDSQYFHVSKKVVKHGKGSEDYWASRFLKFIICANQLASKGLTRELPIIGIFEDKFIVGVIDEIRMPTVTKTIQNPSLVEIKTRVEATLPHESQKRNGRLQLMCYKYLWDNAVADNFPTDQFFKYIEINPGYILPQTHQYYAASNGCPAKTLGELVKVYKSKCHTLPRAHDQLILRYEYQKDQSFLGEVHFTYDSDWLKDQIKGFVKFMSGEQEANYVSKEDQWKCDICDFAAECRWKTNTNSNTDH